MLKTTLPADLEHRLTGLGDVIAAACPDVQFAYLFGSAATGTLTEAAMPDTYLE